MRQLSVRPISDSDWSTDHQVEVGEKTSVIWCRSLRGAKLPPVRKGGSYFYLGKYLGETIPETGEAVFSVYQVTED